MRRVDNGLIPDMLHVDSVGARSCVDGTVVKVPLTHMLLTSALLHATPHPRTPTLSISLPRSRFGIQGFKFQVLRSWFPSHETRHCLRASEAGRTEPSDDFVGFDTDTGGLESDTHIEARRDMNVQAERTGPGATLTLDPTIHEHCVVTHHSARHWSLVTRTLTDTNTESSDHPMLTATFAPPDDSLSASESQFRGQDCAGDNQHADH